MSEAKSSIKRAARLHNDRWNSFDAATQAALAIGECCNDRRGLHIDGLDDDIRDQLIDTWAEIIRQVLASQ